MLVRCIREIIFLSLVLPGSAVQCSASDGSTGTRDCSGKCLTAANCALTIAGYSTCSQWYTDVTCDNGTFKSDDGSAPNWNCPEYACDLSACNSCGTNPSFGKCGIEYTCGTNGVCNQDKTACICNRGYLGFACEFGNGVCPDQFICGIGQCTNGVCICPAGKSGYDCSGSYTTSLPQAEIDVLADLFHTTGGNAWQVNSGWLTASDPCQGGPKGRTQGFYGVICSDDNHVQVSPSVNHFLRAFIAHPFQRSRFPLFSHGSYLCERGWLYD